MGGLRASTMKTIVSSARDRFKSINGDGYGPRGWLYGD
jgi:hypothetical protein